MQKESSQPLEKPCVLLDSAGLETRTEDFLELWHVVKVHQGVVLSGDVCI